MFFGSSPADYEIKATLVETRNHARWLMENNSFAVRAVSLMVDNILGADGIIYRPTAKSDNGKYDNADNKVLSDAWTAWSKEADITDQCSWHDIQRLALTSTIVDGECFLRIIKDPSFKYGLKLALYESDFVDVDYNDKNNNIRMGIEYDDWGRKVAYWLWNEQPNSGIFAKLVRKRIRFPANEIIHVYSKKRVSGNRGLSWLTPVMDDLEDIGRYAKAELQAALNGAVNIGVLEKTINGIPSPGSVNESGEENAPVVINNTDNLTIFEAPNGFTLKKYENGHPNTMYPSYIKAALQSVAAGLCISYNDLANDYESVNYSSLRQSALIVRDHWKVLQNWFIETVCEDLHDIWLPILIFSGITKLPPGKIEKFKSHRFVGRSFKWVDPQKDINSTILALNAGLTTYTKACDELGLDFQELLIERANDEQLIKQLGLVFSTTPQPPQIQIQANE